MFGYFTKLQYFTSTINVWSLWIDPSGIKFEILSRNRSYLLQTKPIRARTTSLVQTAIATDSFVPITLSRESTRTRSHSSMYCLMIGNTNTYVIPIGAPTFFYVVFLVDDKNANLTKLESVSAGIFIRLFVRATVLGKT